MNEKLRYICEFLPAFRKLFDEDVFFTVIDTDCIVQGFSLPVGVPPAYSVGDYMEDPTGVAQEVMRTRQAKRNILPKEAMGAAYEGILVPVMDGNVVVGCLICTHSVELQEQNAEIAVKFQKDVAEISEYIGNITEGIESMSSLFSSMMNIIDKVENDVNSATDIAYTINTNASTSHILAMNASIESARAGEAGKGFAVVATEMGNLANTSKQSADEIKSTLDLIVNHLTFIISSIKNADSLAETNMEKIKKIKETLADTLQLSEKLEKNINN